MRLNLQDIGQIYNIHNVVVLHMGVQKSERPQADTMPSYQANSKHQCHVRVQKYFYKMLKVVFT